MPTTSYSSTVSKSEGGRFLLKTNLRTYFDRIAPELDHWCDRNRYYYRDLEKLCQFLIPTGSRVLEIGSGTGALLHALAPSVGVGVDFSGVAVELARQKHPHLSFYCADAETLSPGDLGADGQFPFDYIVLAGVVGYLSDIQSVLARLHKFCHPKTRIIVAFYNRLWEPALNVAEAIGQRRPQPPQNWLSINDVTNLFDLVGYQTVKTGCRFLIPKRIPGLSYLANRYIAPLPLLKQLCLTKYVIARPQPVSQPAKSQPSCSVIVPARNEAGNIADAVMRLPQLGSRTEVIFVEGHSQDDTWETIQQTLADYRGPHSLRAFQQTGRGKADAVRLGFEQASGDILIILDADLTVPPEDLPHFFEVMASGRGEFINGCRLVYPRSKAAMPLLNTWANRFFARVFSFLLEHPLKDTLCGTKVLWKEDYARIAAGRSYFGDFDPFGDFDLLFGAAKLNLHIVEVPIRYQPRYYGSSNIAHVKEGLVLLRMCAYASQKLKFVA